MTQHTLASLPRASLGVDDHADWTSSNTKDSHAYSVGYVYQDPGGVRVEFRCAPA